MLQHFQLIFVKLVHCVKHDWVLKPIMYLSTLSKWTENATFCQVYGRLIVFNSGFVNGGTVGFVDDEKFIRLVKIEN